ncbi:hypothetical protein STRDD11_01621 [Streptococcus sp. DD11]|nr:hypothetical protein STRDD11_01621 [Streptococcus sp. DD11]
MLEIGQHHLVIALGPALALHIVGFESLRLLLKGFGIVSQSNQLAALHNFKRNFRIFRQSAVFPAADTLDKLRVDQKVGSRNPANLKEMPHPHMVNPLSNHNLLIDTACQEVLIGIAGFIAPKGSYMAFWIFQNLLDQEVESILFRHGIRIIDTDVIPLSHFEGIVENSGLTAGTRTVCNGNVAACILRQCLHLEHFLIGVV